MYPMTSISGSSTELKLPYRRTRFWTLAKNSST